MNLIMSNIYLSLFLISGIVTELGAQSNKRHVLELRAAPMDTVRIGMIGLGYRGRGAVIRLSQIEGVSIKALVDVVPERIRESQENLKKRSLPMADEYKGAEDWKKVCEREDIDLIYVCTHWDLHTQIAVYAMEHGKHVAVEIPAALTIKEAWKLVKTAEKTRKHCFQMENTIYDFFESSVFNMAQQGVLGEIKHVEGAYIHDLRNKLFDTVNGYWNMWRLEHLKVEDGNTYPTHGIGPVAHVLNIHRGDKMSYISSHSSNQFQLSHYAKSKFGEDSEFYKTTYKKGDINTSIIKTENGKTIVLQHDVSSPRPYNKKYSISGTRGFIQKYPNRGISLSPNSHQYLPKEKVDSLLNAYRLPFIKEVETKAKKVGGHGGMDYIMDHRLIYCLRNGLPLDQDVYDAAEWSSLIELSRKSSRKNGKRVKIPDFTRGAYRLLDRVTYYSTATDDSD